MEHYSESERLREIGTLDTGIHTKINEEYRISSVYRTYSNGHFEQKGWETLLWENDKIAEMYTSDTAEEVVSLHTKIAHEYRTNKTIYKEN